MRLLIVAVAAMALSASAAMAQAQPLFLFMYRPGPAWEAGKPMTQQKLASHVTYIRGLIAKGQVVAGGPWTDADGGMAIVRAADAEAAKALLAADPAITTGVFAGEVRTWSPVLDSGKPLKP